MTEPEVEAVARAFYEIMDDAREWEHEPEATKERFRCDARTALVMLDEFDGRDDLPTHRGFLSPAQRSRRHAIH